MLQRIKSKLPIISKKSKNPSVANIHMIHTQPHTQQKYFSLMLVPSYSAGKTRSIRISHKTFYGIFFTIIALIILGTFFHFQSRFFGQIATEVSHTLEQAQMAFSTFQQITEEEQSELIYGVTYLQSNIVEERARALRGMHQQHQDFMTNLEFIRAYMDNLEMQLQQYELERQEIIERLQENAHLPIVNNMLNDLQRSQVNLLATFEDLLDYSSFRRRGSETNNILLLGSSNSPRAANSVTTAEDEADNLMYYITILELALEAQKEIFYELLQQVNIVAPHIRRYNYGPDLLYWSYVRNILPRHTPVQVTDVRTGISFNIISFSHGSHADVFPATREDTAIFHSIYGGQWSWDTRPIWVHINDRKVAASINGMPHAGGGDRGNNMNGHVCIHFRGSRTHSGSASHERDHQNSVMAAYRAGLQ